MKPKNFKVTPISRSVLTLRLNVKSGWEQWFLLTSDRHWDNPDSNRDLQRKHIEQAKERDAWIMDFGDFFCLMQGKYDKRANKSKVRPEHQKDNYLDAVVQTGAKWFKDAPLLLLADGNHDTNILKKHETDIMGEFPYTTSIRR